VSYHKLEGRAGVGNGAPEPGGGYYSVRVEYWAGGVRLYGERLLVRLPTPLSRSRTVQEAVYREAQVDWDNVAEEPGEVKEDEKSMIFQLSHVARLTASEEVCGRGVLLRLAPGGRVYTYHVC